MGKCSWAGGDGRWGMAIDRCKEPGIQGGASKNIYLIENGHEIPVVSGSSDSQ